MKKKFLNIIQQILKIDLNSLSLEDYALEIFLPLLFFSWFFYFLKYYSFIINLFLNFLIIIGWIIYFRRLNEEKSKEEQ